MKNHQPISYFFWEYLMVMVNNGAIASKNIQEQIKEKFSANPKQFLNKLSLENIIEESNESLVSKVNCKLSGTTACICVVTERKVICANVGDSRAVLFSVGNDGKWDVTPLSKDHKFDRKDESSRVERANGRIMQYLNSEGNPFGPKRIWKQNENTPGLAMSRSCGDTIAHSIGVISMPEISEIKLSKSRNYYIVIATDGLWEQLNNIEVMKLLKENISQSPESVCNILQNSARSRWIERDKIIDDITIIFTSIKSIKY